MAVREPSAFLLYTTFSSPWYRCRQRGTRTIDIHRHTTLFWALDVVSDGTRRVESVRVSFFTIYHVLRAALCISAIMQMDAFEATFAVITPRESRCSNITCSRNHPPVCRYSSFVTPPTSISIAVNGSPKLAPMGTLLIGGPSPQRSCSMRTRRGLTVRERQLTVKAASDS